MRIKRSHFILWLVVGVFAWATIAIWLPLLILCFPYLKVERIR